MKQIVQLSPDFSDQIMEKVHAKAGRPKKTKKEKLATKAKWELANRATRSKSRASPGGQCQHCNKAISRASRLLEHELNCRYVRGPTPKQARGGRCIARGFFLRPRRSAMEIILATFLKWSGRMRDRKLLFGPSNLGLKRRGL